MKGQNLKQLWNSLGPRECRAKLTEALKQGHARPEEFSLRELAEAFCGDQWVKALNPRNTSRYARTLTEAGEGVGVSAFADITGQLVFTKILEGWKQATRVSDALFETIQTEFDGEKLPWLSHVKELSEAIHEGQPYPEASFGERWVTTPSTIKKGEIVSVTKEAVFFDRTGQMLRAAQEVGEKAGYHKEILCLRVLLGIDNSYSLNGTTYNTYNGLWTNSQATTPLVDYTSINAAMILFSQMIDPDTQLPIYVEPKQLFVMPANLFNARHLVTATEARNIYPSYSATSVSAPGNVEMIGPNPLPSLEVLSSQIAWQLLTTVGGLSSTAANNVWFIGDFKKAFAYMQNWPITTEVAPPQNIREFEQDIVVRYKASERGVPAVIQPANVCKFTD